MAATALVCASCGRNDEETELLGWRHDRGRLVCGECCPGNRGVFGSRSRTNATTMSAVATSRAVVRAPVEFDPGEPDARAWGDPDGGTAYRIVEAHHVPPELRRATNVSAKFATAHLGLEPASVTYFIEEEAAERAYRDRWGFADWPSFRRPTCVGVANRGAHAIAVRADIGPADVVQVTCHEYRHLVQPLTGMSKADREADATSYGEWASAVLVRSRERYTDVAQNVHRITGRPHEALTLMGVAVPDDVLVAIDGNKRRVYVNRGWNAQPQWREQAACPVV
jgi:hypothetical protein